MARRIKVYSLLRPRAKLGRMVELDQIVAFVANRSGLSRAGITQVINELHDAILFFGRDGRSIKLDGLVRFSPKVSLSGKLSFAVNVDNQLQYRLNDLGTYQGDFINPQNLGKTPKELVEQWNGQHPDDPVL